MDVVAFLIGIILIVSATTMVGLRALDLHHRRYMDTLRLREFENQARYDLMNKAMEMKMLPPSSMSRFFDQ